MLSTRKDVFICLPTGSGKSLCYAALPYAFDGLYGRESSIVIVVSPLIALMKDQVSGITTYIRPYQCTLQVAVLNSKGLAATYISSENREDLQLEKILRGEYKILFISPEMLMLNLAMREMLRTTVYKDNLVAFVIDEVHCVTKWLVIYVMQYTMV